MENPRFPVDKLVKPFALGASALILTGAAVKGAQARPERASAGNVPAHVDNKNKIKPPMSIPRGVRRIIDEPAIQREAQEALSKVRERCNIVAVLHYPWANAFLGWDNSPSSYVSDDGSLSFAGGFPHTGSPESIYQHGGSVAVQPACLEFKGREYLAAMDPITGKAAFLDVEFAQAAKALDLYGFKGGPARIPYRYNEPSVGLPLVTVIEGAAPLPKEMESQVITDAYGHRQHLELIRSLPRD